MGHEGYFNSKSFISLVTKLIYWYSCNLGILVVVPLDQENKDVFIIIVLFILWDKLVEIDFIKITEGRNPSWARLMKHVH